jgi:hypothetical protein
MLEHYFWLLEFKFKFEFHCLNPFQPKTLPFPPFQPIWPRSPTPRPAAARPAASTCATAQCRFMAQLA